MLQYVDSDYDFYSNSTEQLLNLGTRDRAAGM